MMIWDRDRSPKLKSSELRKVCHDFGVDIGWLIPRATAAIAHPRLCNSD
ncbi:MAG: hypothetical protein DSM106950_14515 [Stigonema ocellatum SAG 48.90 = DSM 106950]|nr:hypothetical protein [Stigonema ocellatum SAG 48.90 = DSM 106950]